MIFSQTLRGFIKKELKQVLRDPRMRGMLIVMPLMQMTLFGFALSSDVKNIRLSVMNAQGDTVMHILPSMLLFLTG